MTKTTHERRQELIIKVATRLACASIKVNGGLQVGTASRYLETAREIVDGAGATA